MVRQRIEYPLDIANASSKDRIEVRDFSPRFSWQMLGASERNALLFPSSMSQEARDAHHVSLRLRG
jgi:hypothetical protein